MTSDDRSERERLDVLLAEIGRDAGATLHAYLRPGRAVQRIVLREASDGQNRQVEVAQLEQDGTLRVAGQDTGPKVTEFFGPGITSYEWQYVVAHDRVTSLLSAIGGHEGDDVLAALAACYEQRHGVMHDLLTSPQVGASFSNWHS